MATKPAEVVQDGDGVLDVDAIEVPSATAITAIERAQVDLQIATAHAYPRSLARVMSELVTLCTTDQETAESCTYALQRRGADNEPTYIVGPSVRFAELLVHCMGNTRAGGRIVAIDDTMITGQGVCHDLEKNVAVSIEARRRITNKKGRRYNDDMIVTTGNAAIAIGFRNAVFKVYPKAVWGKAWEAARAMARGEGVPIETRRKKVLTYFAKLGKTEADVCRVLSVAKAEDIGEEQLEVANALRVSINEGAKTVDDIFNGGDGGTQSPKTERLNQQISGEPEPVEGSPAADRSHARHKLYMVAINKAMDAAGLKTDLERDDFRHTWQREHIGKESTAQWSAADYTRAIQMVETGIGF